MLEHHGCHRFVVELGAVMLGRSRQGAAQLGIPYEAFERLGQKLRGIRSRMIEYQARLFRNHKISKAFKIRY